MAPLLSDFVRESYLPFARQNKRSWQLDRSNLERHVLPHLGSRRLNQISTAVLEGWIDTLKRTGLSESSCFRLFWLTKSVLNCAVRWGALDSDSAFKSARMSVKPGRQPVLLDAADMVRLLDILKTDSHQAAANAIHLMLLTGASKSEILQACWDDVDVEQGTLRVARAFTGRPHFLPLNTEAINFIQKLPRRAGTPWLFFTRRGTRLSSIARQWASIRERLGRPELRLQDLRHSFVHVLVSMGVHQHDLRMILGHYKPDTLTWVRKRAAEAAEAGQA